MHISDSVKNWSRIPQRVDGRWYSIGAQRKALMDPGGHARPAPPIASFPSSPPEPKLQHAPGFSAASRLAELTSTPRTPISEIINTINPRVER
jgi:hypothetical protein